MKVASLISMNIKQLLGFSNLQFELKNKCLFPYKVYFIRVFKLLE